MRKAIVVLHFGAHKTGTSLLQKFMRDRPNEITRSGIYAISRSETNELLGWGNNFLKNPTNLVNRIDSIYSKGFKYIVISHENALGRPFVKGGEFLYPLASSLIDNYRHHLSKYDVRFIFYIRDTADFVESYYIQTVQEGSCRSFRKWLASFGGCENLSWSPLVKSIKLANFNSLEIINFQMQLNTGKNNL